MQVRHDLGPALKRRSYSILVISILALAILYLVVGAVPARAQQPAGDARIVVNNVTATLASERILLSNGKTVFQNEDIETLANSSTLIALRDNTQLAICPTARVTLKSINPTTAELVIFIASGCFRYTSGELLKAAYINTPSAVIRPYGTIVTVTVSGRGGTTVSVAEGAATITGAGRSVIVGAGQSTLVARGSAPTPPVPTPPQPPIVTEMDRLLTTASMKDFGTRAAARSPAVEAPTDAGTNIFSPVLDSKIQSEIIGDCFVAGRKSSRTPSGASPKPSC